MLAADYRIVRSNSAASRLFELFVQEPARATEPLDMFSLLFDPGLARPFVLEWEQLAGKMLARLHREVLHSGGDSRLASLLERALRFPGVHAQWRRPELSTRIDSTLEVWLQRGDLRAGFMTTITVFSAPRLVTLEELRIESYFPLDETTRSTCERLAAARPATFYWPPGLEQGQGQGHGGWR